MDTTSSRLAAGAAPASLRRARRRHRATSPIADRTQDTDAAGPATGSRENASARLPAAYGRRAMPTHDLDTTTRARAQHRWMTLAVILLAVAPLELVTTGHAGAGVLALSAGLAGAAKLLPHLRPDSPNGPPPPPPPAPPAAAGGPDVTVPASYEWVLTAANPGAW